MRPRQLWLGSCTLLLTTMLLASASPSAAQVPHAAALAYWAEGWRLVDQRRPAEASAMFQRAQALQDRALGLQRVRPRCSRARPIRLCLARR